MRHRWWIACMLVAGWTSPALAQATSEDTSVACRDGLDNDGDGRVDCADPGCAVFCGGPPARTSWGAPAPPAQPAPEPARTSWGAPAPPARPAPPVQPAPEAAPPAPQPAPAPPEQPEASAAPAEAAPEDPWAAAIARAERERMTAAGRSSLGLLVSTAVLDALWLGLSLADVVFTTAAGEATGFFFSGPFLAPMMLADTGFLTGWHQALARRGAPVDGRPLAASWALAALSFVGAWITLGLTYEHLDYRSRHGDAYRDEDDPMHSTVVGYLGSVNGGVVALAMVTIVAEVANYFLRAFWWRPALRRANDTLERPL